MKKSSLIIVVAVVVLAVGGLGYWYTLPNPSGEGTIPVGETSGQASAPSPAATTSPTTAPAAPTSSQPATATITYTASGFSPATLTIAQGTTVVFKNESSNPFWPASNVHPTHTLYDGTTLQQHCANPTSDTFDACGGIAPGTSWSFTFNKVGTWAYHNHMSVSHGGTIIVK